MAGELLFKYRSLDNWKFLLDILLEQRLYAASFRSLNDPMEGRYSYRGDDVTQAFLRAIRLSKDYWKICSLTRNGRNTLMWAYYGGGHSGVALGVRVRPSRDQRGLPVRYDSEVTIGPRDVHRPPREVAIEILSQKQVNWLHEQEFRVFSNQPFVKIELKQILLGCQMSDRDRELITKLVRKAKLRAKIVPLRRSDLDEPSLVEKRLPTQPWT